MKLLESVTERMTWQMYTEKDPESRDLELVQGTHYFTRHIPVVLQHGPTCGIAVLTALLLARDPNTDIVRTASDLLSEAVSEGISIQGELLSPLYMSTLCGYMQIEHEVLRVNKDTDLTDILRDSVLMLIYDKDKNNEPTTHNGERAHWLLITGFCYKPRKNKHRPRHADVMMTANSVQKPCNSFTKSRVDAGSDMELYVFVQHGRSRFRQLWKWSDILTSNENVRRAKPGTWVVPDNLHEHVAGVVVRVRAEHVQLNET